eukprot:m.257564 g.257564  ORF g.257564 m.257564 type:complete len:500 (+) comp20963_c0_seq1:12-1511(+)
MLLVVLWALLAATWAAPLDGRGSNGAPTSAAEDVLNMTVPIAVPTFGNIAGYWRQGHLDWHSLMRVPSVPSEDCANTRRLIRTLRMREEDRVSRLLNEWEGGTEDKSVDGFRMCGKVSEPCVLYGSQDICASDGLCYWCAASSVCLPRVPLSGLSTAPCADVPPVPSLSQWTDVVRYTTGRSVRQHDTSGCAAVITAPVITVTQRPGVEEMYFHWHTEIFDPLYTRLVGTASGRAALAQRRVQILLTSPLNPLFFNYFGLLTDLCPRAIVDLPNNTCIVSTLGLPSQVPARLPTYDHFMRARLLTPEERQPPARATVGIISRRVKRFILNEAELVRQIKSTYDVDVVILPLEDMTLEAQIAALHKTTVLVGVHGSGLVNALFLPRESAMIQIMPYKVGSGGDFFLGFAQRNAVHYYEWANTEATRTVLHGHHLPDSVLKEHGTVHKYVESVRAPVGPGGNPHYFTFWINQDTIVDWVSFETVLRRALCKGINKNFVECS